jgi:hypothetical protein
MFGIETEERDVSALIVRQEDAAMAADPRMMISAQGGDNVIITAQKVAQPRNMGAALRDIGLMAKVAGADWYYSIPFRDNRANKTTYVEGLSIKGAMEVVRIFGNCQVDCRVEDVQHSWVFYARFTDLETGFTLVRPFQARKSAAEKAMKDRERALDIAFQIGASKALRNVVTNALQTPCAHAFEQAKQSLVERIGKDLERYKSRCIVALQMNEVPLARVERVRGKPFDQWNARDLAMISGEMQSIKDGMVTWEETYPPIDQPDGGDAAEEATLETAPAKQRKAAQKKVEPPKPEETQQQQDPQGGEEPKPEEGRKPAEEQKATSAIQWDVWPDAVLDHIDRLESVPDVNSYWADHVEPNLGDAPEGALNRLNAIKQARINELKAEAR